MIGKITKIDPPKRSVNGNAFIRVHFKLKDNTWAKTDICPDYRNYKRWAPLLQVENVLENLNMKDATTVDADSSPTLKKQQPKLF